MDKRKRPAKKPELLGGKFPAREKIDLDDFLLHRSPIPIQYTLLWRVIYAQLHHAGCCCCCGHVDRSPIVLPGAPVPGLQPPVVAPAPAPQAPNITVDLDVLIRQFIVGGSFAVEANFEWTATGAPGLKVFIQVKTNITFRNWTNVLSNQPPVDVGTWPVRGVPGERFHFRALATDPQGNDAYSRIITINP